MRSTQRVPTQVQTSNRISACVQAARQSRACNWQLSVGGGGGGLIPTRFACVCVFPQRRPSSPPTCAWTQPQQFRSRHSPHGEDWWTWPSYRSARCMRTCGTGKPRMAPRSIHDTHGTHRTHDRAASNAMPLARSFRTSCIARVAAAHSPHHSALRLQSPLTPPLRPPPAEPSPRLDTRGCGQRWQLRRALRAIARLPRQRH